MCFIAATFRWWLIVLTCCTTIPLDCWTTVGCDYRRLLPRIGRSVKLFSSRASAISVMEYMLRFGDSRSGEWFPMIPSSKISSEISWFPLACYLYKTDFPMDCKSWILRKHYSALLFSILLLLAPSLVTARSVDSLLRVPVLFIFYIISSLSPTVYTHLLSNKSINYVFIGTSSR